MRVLVERAYMGEPKLPATILRLPIVYGPGDWRRHRMLPYVRRMTSIKRPTYAPGAKPTAMPTTRPKHGRRAGARSAASRPAQLPR
jgi:hypothetical protein